MIERVFEGQAGLNKGADSFGNNPPFIYAVLGGDFMICFTALMSR
ncbi:MAG: hypothetical protein AB9903_28125 [Vulcanimicrobiota bacterium]